MRNSGAVAVIEGIGDHGCEYMTGGRVVVLGPTGRNFAAGMSGGIAYVYDPDDKLLSNCNLGTVELERVDQSHDKTELKHLIELHERHTGSLAAQELLSSWHQVIEHFVKVMPTDYKRVLSERMAHDEEEDADSRAQDLTQTSMT